MCRTSEKPNQTLPQTFLSVLDPSGDLSIALANVCDALFTNCTIFVPPIDLVGLSDVKKIKLFRTIYMLNKQKITMEIWFTFFINLYRSR